ncbi:MAG TPA: GTPase [Patescibacteria group bacterium]|nr:GTPase [Patescibacteria group bacterium]
MTIDLEAKIEAVEEEIRKTPYHKGTEHYIGRLKAKLAKLKRQKETNSAQGKGKGFALKKFGDATVVLVGPPSVGKSSLLNNLTGTHARVESWPFTTLEVIPGVLKYKGAQIQILDLPGIIGRAAEGKGRGKEILSVVRIADLLILMVDVKTKNKLAAINKELKLLKIELPTLLVVNKVDLLNKASKTQNKEILISIQNEIGLDELKKAIWQELNLIRVYLKQKDKEPDFNEPLIMKKGAQVAGVAQKIFPEKKEFKQILLWGPSALFPGQQVSLNHQLKDEDVLSFS